MTLYVLDTDTCSFVIRQRPMAVLQQMQVASDRGDQLVISVITYAELRLGVERSQAKQKHKLLVDAFVERLDAILPWDGLAADQFAALQAWLFSNGAPIGSNDTMIAAHVLSVEGVIVTDKVKHFGKVPALTIENWGRVRTTPIR